VGAEAFKAFIKQNAHDFITFKTDNLLKDAGDNPFKRAEVISEIVGSISRIPDPIKRQVFFQTTARQLKVDEQTLISESNRLIRKQRDQQVKDSDRQQERDARNRPASQAGSSTAPSAPNPGLSDFSDGPPEDFFNDLLDEAGISPAPDSQKTENRKHEIGGRSAENRPPLSYQEEECIRLLMNYGARELEPGVSLCHYILSELNDIDFQHEPYGQLLTLFRDSFSQGRILMADDFMHLRIDLPTEQANSLQYQAISLTTQRYEISDQWEEKHKIFVPSEEDTGVLAEAAYGNILRLKKLLAETRMHDLLQQIRTTTDPAASDQLMADYMHFKRVDVEIARLLGTVISG
jgi:DNA primase